MLKLYLALALLHILHCNGKICQRSKKPLEMIVLYESLCPDSQSYIKNFWPVYRKYHQCINLTLVPYGKASPSSSAPFGHTCQHGDSECWGNRMQDCAIHSNLNQFDQMKFLECQMKDLQLTVKKNFTCARALNIEDHVERCMRPSGRGNQLQTQSSIITNRYSFSVIPAIVYDGVFSVNLQRSSRMKVSQTLCNIMIKKNLLLPDDC
ncbi:PREDICTED: GILT-like protein F37H8.5 [Drosophila arizonae]|uniref:GILT-like protein F37H8.5 n=1 Tax=Drosophila arizonae TaxID=7263 RepID=A0ABM1PLW5_DROAR|nr:PREDICTED: GILT-like protein F37H8.5 [Drosophila arizonae]